MGFYQDALNCFKRAIELDPNYISALNNKGICYEKIGNYEDAIKCYNKSIELNPNYATGICILI